LKSVTLQNFIFQVCGWLVGLPLEFLVVSALARGPYRLFPLVFVYAAANFITTLIEIPPYVVSFVTGNPQIWKNAAEIYWINDVILQVLIFAVVIGLIDSAASGASRRRMIRIGLAAGAILFGGVSRYWMTPWTRDLNFCATVLDLGLWMLLIASRKADRRLLLVSGALGMQFTGEAIGEAIRDLSIPKMVHALSLTGSVVAMVADLACLYIWWQAFRAAPARQILPGRK
jgi:hypothetical protein